MCWKLGPSGWAEHLEITTLGRELERFEPDLMAAIREPDGVHMSIQKGQNVNRFSNTFAFTSGRIAHKWKDMEYSV